MSLVSLAVPFYYNPNPARVKRNEGMKKNEGTPPLPTSPRAARPPPPGGQEGMSSLPPRGKRPEADRGISVPQSGTPQFLHWPQGPSFLPFITASLCGGISRASASRPWLPRPSSDRGRRSPAATRPRSLAAFAAVPDPLDFPCFSHSFPPLQPMRALENRCKLCHNINYENVGSRGCGSGF